MGNTIEMQYRTMAVIRTAINAGQNSDAAKATARESVQEMVEGMDRFEACQACSDMLSRAGLTNMEKGRKGALQSAGQLICRALKEAYEIPFSFSSQKPTAAHKAAGITPCSFRVKEERKVDPMERVKAVLGKAFPLLSEKTIGNAVADLTNASSAKQAELAALASEAAERAAEDEAQLFEERVAAICEAKGLTKKADVERVRDGLRFADELAAIHMQ